MVRLLPPERDFGVLRAPIRSSLALAGMFLVVLLAVGLLERIGVDAGFAPVAVVGAAFALFALAALYSHSRRAADFYVADRKVSGAFGGLSGAAGFAGLVAVGLAGGAYESPAAFFVAMIGLALGYLILAFLIAPGLRSFGAYTAGDFVATRFSGVLPRLAFAVIGFSVSFLLLLAHLKLSAPLIATLAGITPEHALYAAAALTVMATLPGGMRSLTWTHAIQYFVIALACLVPAGFLATGAMSESATAQDFGTILKGNLPALSGVAAQESALPMVLLALGAASLPQLLGRVLTAPSSREAGTSMVWAVLFSAILVVAGFVLFELLIGAVGPEAPASALGGLMQLAALFSALPAVLAGLVLAGTLAALFALGQAALFAATTALSHDIFDEIVDRKGPEGRRIIVARLVLIGVAAAAAGIVPLWHAEAPSLLGWALALAAAGTFVPLVLGLWWRRCNEIGATGGMVAGFGFTALVFLLEQNVISGALVASGWAEVGAPTAAVAGLVVALAVTVGLSLVTPAAETDAAATGMRSGSRQSRLPIRERPA